MLLALTVLIAMLATVQVSASEIFRFPLRDDTDLLLADANSQFITLISQDPATKMITVKVQVHQGAAATEAIAVSGLGIAFSFNNRVAPYSYNAAWPTIFPPGVLHSSVISTEAAFRQYFQLLLNPLDTDVNAMYLERAAATGGRLTVMMAKSDRTSYVEVAPGETVDFAEFYFMPINIADKLDLNMFSFVYFFEGYDFLRASNFFGRGTYFLEATSERMNPEDQTYIVNPSSFKLHIQRPAPSVSANNDTRQITGYNADSMEWSYSETGPFTSSEPVVKDEPHSIFVREKGDSAYSGSDALYGDYKKYLTSEPAEVIFTAKGGVTYYTVTFDSNGGTPTTPQTRNVVAGNAIGAGNMPSVPTSSAGEFIEWNTQQDGLGTEFKHDTIVNDNITVYAKYDDSGEIRVSFDVNCEDGVLTGASYKTVFAGLPYGELPGDSGPWNVYQPGGFGYMWEFSGWNIFPDTIGDWIDENTTVTNTSDHTLYARWRNVKLFDVLTVTFDGNGGVPANQIVDVEAGVAIGADKMGVSPTRTDYSFTGWNTIRNGTGTEFTENSVVDVSIKVYAQWYPPIPYCTVTFDSNYAGSVDQEVIVEQDCAVGDEEMPEDPERNGYTFEGWNTSADGQGTPFTSSTLVPEDIRVYAQWAGGPVTTYYTVTFDSQGGEPDDETREVAEGTAIGAANMPDDPELDGYEFAGWFTEPDGEGDEFTGATLVNDDITVYALWEEAETHVYCTVTFEFQDDGATAPQTRKVLEGAAVGSANMPGAPSFSGYIFAGWNTEPDGAGDEFTATTRVDEDITVYAQWTEDPDPTVTKYTVTFRLNDTTTASILREVEEDTALGTAMPANPTRSGYTFYEWNTEQNGGGDEFTSTTIVTTHITVYAQWDEDDALYTVTFNGNGGTLSGSATRQVTPNTALGSGMPNNPSRTGYTFNGWNTALNGSGSSFTANTLVTRDITVYAQWTQDEVGPTYYTVTFDGNGGSPTSQTRTVARGSSVGAGNMPSNMARTGYTFAGWNTRQDGTGTEFTGTTTVTSSIIVYARWNVDTLVPLTDDHIAYIRGYPNNTVRPDNAITRAEVAMIFFRLIVDNNKNTPRTSGFKDVVSGAWYAQAVSYLASTDIIKGYPDGTFKPNQPITRAEFAAIASRFDRLEATSSNAFPDISNHWAKEAINSAAQKGWVDGYPDGTFLPQRNISRAEVVKIVNAMLNRMIQVEDIPLGIRNFTDLTSSHWAYANIVEAANEHDYVRKSDGYEIWTLR